TAAALPRPPPGHRAHRPAVGAGRRCVGRTSGRTVRTGEAGNRRRPRTGDPDHAAVRLTTPPRDLVRGTTVAGPPELLATSRPATAKASATAADRRVDEPGRRRRRGQPTRTTDEESPW